MKAIQTLYTVPIRWNMDLLFQWLQKLQIREENLDTKVHCGAKVLAEQLHSEM